MTASASCDGDILSCISSGIQSQEVLHPCTSAAVCICVAVNVPHEIVVLLSRIMALLPLGKLEHLELPCIERLTA